MRLSDRHRYSVADRPEGEKWQSVALYCAVAPTAVAIEKTGYHVDHPAGRLVFLPVGEINWCFCWWLSTCTKPVLIRQAVTCLFTFAMRCYYIKTIMGDLLNITIYVRYPLSSMEVCLNAMLGYHTVLYKGT